MKIKDIFDKKRLVFFFEIFPPKLASPIVYTSIEISEDKRWNL